MGKKKLFNLLSGESIHVAPNTKVIPAKVFTKALSAADILSHAQEAIDKYRMEVANECERLKAQAQQEGFQEGFVRWAEHLAELEREIQNVNRATEKMIIPVALKAAKKILGREIELSDQAVVDIVASKLKAVKQAKQVVIHVCPLDYPKLEGNRKQLAELFEKLESLSIRPNEEVQQGGCIIETESGIINAQLDKQWEILEHAFQSMMT